MKNRQLALLCAVLLVSAVWAADVPFTDFSGGMNLADNKWRVQPNQSYRCQNWLLDRPLGSLHPRPGYGPITDSTDSVLAVRSLYAYRWGPYGGRLLTVTEHADSGWGMLQLSGANAFEPGSTLRTWLYPCDGYWLASSGRLVFFSDRDWPVMIKGLPPNVTCFDLIPDVTGQPFVRQKKGGNLSGQVIYAYVRRDPISTRAGNDEDWSSRTGPLSKVIQTDSSQVRLKGFLNPYSTAGYHEWQRWVLILRSKLGRLNWDLDSLYILDSVLVPDTVPNGAIAHDLEYIDNALDATLGPAFCAIGKHDADFEDYTNWPSFEESDSTAPHGAPIVVTAVALGSGDTLCNSIVDSGVFYAYVLLDTVTGSYSDISGACFQPAGDASPTTILEQVSIRVPYPPEDEYNPGQTNMVRLVLRAQNRRTDDIRSWYVIDTLKGYNTATSSDTLTWVEMVASRPEFFPSVPDERLRGAVVHDGTAFAWSDFAIYQSKPDSLGQFTYFNSLELDLDDGDRTVRCASFDGNVLAMKTNSTWILKTADGEVYDRTQIIPGLGIIAPRSWASYNGESFFLSKRGVINLSQGQFRQYALQSPFISLPIDPLLVRSADEMQHAVGACWRDYYLLTYPGTDTTFAYSLKSKGWSIWTFEFSGAVEYDTLNRTNFTTFEDLIFSRAGDDRLYLLADTFLTDNGDTIEALWERRNVQPSIAPQIIDQVFLTHELEPVASDTSLYATLTVVTNAGDTVCNQLFTRSLLLGDLVSQYIRSDTVNMTATDYRVALSLHKDQVNGTIDGVHVRMYPVGMEVEK